MNSEHIEMIGRLIEELDDAVSFMDTLSEWEDEEGEERRLYKEVLVQKARRMFAPNLQDEVKECPKCSKNEWREVGGTV